MGKRPRKRAASGRRGLARVEAELAGLTEEERRRRLLELLREDLGEEEEERRDEDWRMPELDGQGRTAPAGGMELGFQGGRLEAGREALEQLGRACRLVFALDGSSWLPCSAEPRCLAEKLARAVFDVHAKGVAYDAESSGAEWWAQVRQPGHSEEAIQFHWDTDEAAVETRGVNVHPHLSTVTYLTDCGAPTLIVDKRNARCPKKVKGIYGAVEEGLLSRPRAGKHIAFDGQLLHGTAPNPGSKASKKQRVTFLVNIWLNHRPSHCRPVPEELAERLGDVSLPISLTCSGELSCTDVTDASDATYELLAPFGRRKPHVHCLRATLPVLPPGETSILRFAKGAAELGANANKG